MKLTIIVLAVLLTGAVVIADAAGDVAAEARAAKAPGTDRATVEALDRQR